MNITIDGKISTDPKDRILALEAVTRSICEATGQDPAEGIMMLLTAAAHMSDTYSKHPLRDSATHLGTALGCAIVAADGFFKLRVTDLSKGGEEPAPVNGGDIGQ